MYNFRYKSHLQARSSDKMSQKTIKLSLEAFKLVLKPQKEIKAAF